MQYDLLSGTTLKTGSTHGTGSVRASKSTADGAGLALEAVVALLAAGEDTALLLKVGHANSRKSGSGVVLGSVVVNLVDRDRGVDDVGLNDLCKIN